MVGGENRSCYTDFESVCISKYGGRKGAARTCGRILSPKLKGHLLDYVIESSEIWEQALGRVAISVPVSPLYTVFLSPISPYCGCLES